MSQSAEPVRDLESSPGRSMGRVRASARLKQLENDLAAAEARERASSEVLRLVAAGGSNPEHVLDLIAKHAAKLCGAEFAHVFRFDGALLHLSASHGLSADALEAARKSWPHPPDRGSAAGRAILTLKVSEIPDMRSDPEYSLGDLAETARFRSGVGVPILLKSRPIGVITVARSTVGPLPRSNLVLLEIFADQAAIAIENASLFREARLTSAELHSALERQTAISEVLRSISRSPFDLQTVLDAVTCSAARLCGADLATLRIREGDEYRLAATFGYTPEWRAHVGRYPKTPGRGSVFGRTVLEGRTVHIPDLLSDREFARPDTQRLLGARAALGAPLLKDGSLVGVLVLQRLSPGPFAPTQIALLETFAEQVVVAIGNAAIFEQLQSRTHELQEALEYQTAAGDVLNVISRSPSALQPVLDMIVETAGRLCQAYDAIIMLCDGGELRVAAHRGPIPVDFSRHPVDRGWVTGRAVVDRAAIHVHDLVTESEEFPDGSEMARRLGHRTILSAPLMREDAAIGAITLRRTTVRPFTERQINVLKTFADQAVIAIENVRLFGELQARTRELQEALEFQTATSEVLSVISRAPSELEPVFKAMVATAARLCAADMAAVLFLLRDGMLHMAESNSTDAEFVRYSEAHPVPLTRGSLVGRTALEMRTVHLPDCLADPEYSAFDYQRIGKYRTMLGVPLVRDGGTVGVICLMRGAPRPFSQKQIDLVTVFADQAVIAIENARLFNELQEKTAELTDALEQQTATSEVLQVISRSKFDLQPVLDAIVQSANRLCEADGANVWLPSVDGTYFPAASFGMAPAFSSKLQGVRIRPEGRSIISRALQTRDTIHIPDITQDPAYTHMDPAKFGGYRSHLGVPILREGNPVGVLTIGRRTPRPFTRKQIGLVTTFADQAVIAIENVRLFEEVQARTQDLARTVEELKALSDVSHAVNSTLDVETVLNTIVAKAVQLSSTDAGAIYVFSNLRQKFRLRATYGMSQSLIEAVGRQRIGLGEPYVGTATLSRTVLQVADLATEPSSPMRDLILDAGFRALLVVPLLRGPKVIGALVVRRKQPGLFSKSTAELLQAFAAQSVLAIHNARLFSEVEENGRELAIASRHKSQFLANMSHELRTPLNAIIGLTEMMREDAEEPAFTPFAEPLERVHRAGKHLLQLINDVLDLSKIEAGRIELQEEMIDVGDMIRDLVVTARPLALRNGNSIEAQIDPSLTSIRGDAMRVRQVLLNLLSNACKFTEQGVVTLAARPEDGNGRHGVSVTVKDTGIGMTEEQVARLFSEFTQADASTTRRYGGTGLGLAISKRLVEMMQGQIDVESSAGQGSAFTVWLPVNAAVADVRAAKPSTSDGRAKPGAPRVLVVDDDPDTRDLMRRFLARESYDVLTAADAAEAMSLVRQFRPDLITLDVVMPQADGWSLLRALKENPSLATIPVVMLSILDEQEKGFALGAADYLGKPIDGPRLRSILRRHCARMAGLHVLVIEDDQPTRLVLRDMLQQEGCAVHLAEDGAEGLSLLDEARPDLILLDLMMPTMDGFTFLDALRARRGGASVPVVVLTAKDLTDAESARLAGEARSVLRKSLHDRDELAAELRRVLAQEQRETTPA